MFLAAIKDSRLLTVVRGRTRSSRTIADLNNRHVAIVVGGKAFQAAQSAQVTLPTPAPTPQPTYSPTHVPTDVARQEALYSSLFPHTPGLELSPRLCLLHCPHPAAALLAYFAARHVAGPRTGRARTDARSPPRRPSAT